MHLNFFRSSSSCRSVKVSWLSESSTYSAGGLAVGAGVDVISCDVSYYIVNQIIIEYSIIDEFELSPTLKLQITYNHSSSYLIGSVEFE